MTIEISVTPALSRTMQGEAMLPAEEVMSMVRLHQCGWGAKRIAKEFGCARIRFVATFARVASLRIEAGGACRRSTGSMTGCGNALPA